MGCHRRLGYARLLNRSGFGFVTVFVPAYVSRFLHYSARSLKKGFSVCFHSVQPLPNSHNKSVCFLVPQHFTHLFSHLLHAVIVYSVTLHFLNRISNPHLPLGITPHGALSQPSFNQPQVFSTQSNANKNMCQTLVHTAEVAGCPVPVHFLLSPSLKLAVGSQRSSRSSFHLLHSFRKPTAVRRATLLHAVALRAVFTFFIEKNCTVHIYIVILLYIYLAMGIIKEEIYTVEQNEIALIIKAISHPARIAIMEFLLEQKSCICNDIVGILDLSQPTISNHLKELKNAGIIKGSIEGKSVCYCIDYDVFNKVFLFMEKFKNQSTQPCC